MVRRDKYAAAKAFGADTLRMTAEDAVTIADIYLGPLRDPQVRAALADSAFVRDHFTRNYLDFRSTRRSRSVEPPGTS